jgi:hypothetical protein
MKDGWGQRQDSIHIFNFSPLTGEGSELFGDFFNLADTLKSYFILWSMAKNGCPSSEFVLLRRNLFGSACTQVYAFIDPSAFNNADGLTPTLLSRLPLGLDVTEMLFHGINRNE